MATNGILLGQNNNEESLKKEIFFISDPITYHRGYQDTDKLYYSWSLPEETKKYSYVSFGIYDGNISTQLTPPGNGSAKLLIYFNCYSTDFYIYNRSVSSNQSAISYIDNFTFSKNEYGKIYLFTDANLETSANFVNASYHSSLSAFSPIYLYSKLSLGNSTDFIDFNIRFYLEGIK